jgi:hypothetical protein
MADEQQFGYGQLDPSNTATEYAAHRFVIDQVLANVRTMVLVKVVKVTNDGGLAAVGNVDVQPLVKQIDGQNNATSHGTIFGVPYTRVQGGKNAVIIDPEVDDIGWMAIADRDISAVKSTKAEAAPGSPGRKFSLADGVYMGGILNAVPEQYIRFHSDGIEWVDKHANAISSGSAGVTINGVTIDRTGKFTGDVKVVGEVTAKFGTAAFVGLSTHWTLTFNTPPKPGS